MLYFRFTTVIVIGTLYHAVYSRVCISHNVLCFISESRMSSIGQLLEVVNT